MRSTTKTRGEPLGVMVPPAALLEEFKRGRGTKVLTTTDGRILFFIGCATEQQAVDHFEHRALLPAYLEATGGPRGREWRCSALEITDEHSWAAGFGLPLGWGVEVRAM